MNTVATDPFVRLVSQAREAGQYRDALARGIDRRNADRLATLLRRGQYEAAGCANMIAHETPTYSYVDPNRPWDGSTYSRVRPTLTTITNVSWHEEKRKPRRVKLTTDTHYVLRVCIDQRRREVVAATDALQAAVGRIARETPEQAAARLNAAWQAETWRGMISARETRHSERGASGIRGVPGYATRVSVRDAHKPTALLLPLNVVGVATHPDATDDDYTRLVQTVRQHPTWSTLRRLMPGPHGYSSVLSTVVPVSYYREAREARKHEARTAHVAPAPVVPEVLRYASVVGYTGNVQ